MEVRRLNVAGPKTGIARGLVDPKLNLMLSRVPGDRCSLIRGLPPITVEGSTPSSPLITPILREGMDGSPYLDLLGTDYLRQVRLQGSQARVFSLSCEESAFGVNPVETPLHRLPFKREVLWEDVSYLLIKRAVEHVEMTCPEKGGGVCSYPIISSPRSPLSAF